MAINQPPLSSRSAFSHLRNAQLNQRLTFKVLAVLLTCLLSACSTAPRVDAPQVIYAWPERLQQLEQLQNWQFSGKIGIRHPQDSISASLRWKQQFDTYHIYMAGPLGQGAINIRGSEAGVTLETSDDRYAATTPEALLQDRLGWSLPMQQLLYWVKGMPAPGSPHTQQLDEANRLISLEQDQWQISYSRYQATTGIDLPHKIILRHGSDLRVTFIMSEWQLGQSLH